LGQPWSRLMHGTAVSDRGKILAGEGAEGSTLIGAWNWTIGEGGEGSRFRFKVEGVLRSVWLETGLVGEGRHGAKVDLTSAATSSVIICKYNSTSLDASFHDGKLSLED